VGLFQPQARNRIEPRDVLDLIQFHGGWYVPEQADQVRRQQRRPDVIEAVEHLAWALAAGGQVSKATRLLACAAREREKKGIVLPPVDQPYHQRALEAVQDAWSAEAFAEAWAQGQGLDLDDVSAFALSDEAKPDLRAGAE
jgi:hypothetical protein